MDPVSLTASIITLINATTVTGSTLTRAWGLRASPLYVISAINEISDFKATLTLVHSTLDSYEGELPDNFSVELERLLHRARSQLEGFHRYLREEVLREGETAQECNKPKLRRRAMIKEMLGENQSKIETLRQELVSIKVSLGVVLGAVQVQSMPKLFMSIQEISIIQTNRTPDIVVHPSDTSQTAAILEQASCTSFTPEDDTNNSMIKDMTERDSVTKSIHHTCQRPCPCQCHQPFQIGSPRWLQGLIGAAFFTSTGTPVLNRRACNLKSCGNDGSLAGSARFQYCLPTWFLPLCIQITGSWRALNGIGSTWTLRIPRVIRPGTIYMFFHDKMQYGTPTEVRAAMDKMHMRAFDLFPGIIRTLFELAVAFNREDICYMLLELGADLKVQNGSGITIGQYFFRRALSSSEFESLRESPQLEDDFHTLGLTSLHKIVLGLSDQSLGHQLLLDPLLVSARDTFGFTPLHWAAKNAELQAIDVLINAGADVNAVCYEGRSVLSWATESGSVDCCKLLLDIGADTRLVDRNGDDALHWALRKIPPTLEVVDLLLKGGAYVNLRSLIEGTTPIMQAAKMGTVEMCELLFAHGANIETPDFYGFTAIFYAVSENNHSTLKFLCDQGALLNRTAKDGTSILHWAAFYGDIKIMSILREARIEGARIDIDAIKEYSALFYTYREKYFRGVRAPTEVELAELQALIDSVVPYPDPEPTSPSFYADVPGAFPIDIGEDIHESHPENESEDDPEAFFDTVEVQNEEELAVAEPAEDIQEHEA